MIKKQFTKYQSLFLVLQIVYCQSAPEPPLECWISSSGNMVVVNLTNSSTDPVTIISPRNDGVFQNLVLELTLVSGDTVFVDVDPAFNSDYISTQQLEPLDTLACTLDLNSGEYDSYLPVGESFQLQAVYKSMYATESAVLSEVYGEDVISNSLFFIP